MALPEWNFGIIFELSFRLGSCINFKRLTYDGRDMNTIYFDNNISKIVEFKFPLRDKKKNKTKNESM